FGQHFLTDRGVISRIVSEIDPRPGDRLLEIGPGLAALTDVLMQRVEKMLAIEIDRDLAQRLRRRYGERLTLTEADVLDVDFAPLAADGPLRIVGNLPYNISSPLLVRLIDFRHLVIDQHFMLQKEVVDRIVAVAGDPAYGRLGALLQAFYDVDALFDVPPDAFDPPPRVDSAVFRMLPRTGEAPVRPEVLSALLQAAFGQRRKMLRKTLVPWLEQRGVDPVGIEPTDRPEDVPVATYIELAKRLEARMTGNLIGREPGQA
ncbi:MAG: ribosomal methyltransferase KsgA/Dim1 family protein, partial [Pseudomonadota bacterium]